MQEYVKSRKLHPESEMVGTTSFIVDTYRYFLLGYTPVQVNHTEYLIQDGCLYDHIQNMEPVTVESGNLRIGEIHIYYSQETSGRT